MGAADYLALCEHFDIIILRNIPKMTVSQKTEARRFITLIDALYDNRVRKEKQIFRKPKNELALLTLSLFLFPPSRFVLYAQRLPQSVSSLTQLH